MSNDYVVDVFTDQPRKWMSDYPFRRVSGKYGVYYSVCTTNAGRVAVSKMAHKSGVKYRYYEKNGAGQIRTVVNFLSTIKPRTAVVIVTVH